MILDIKRGNTILCSTSDFIYSGSANEVRRISADIKGVKQIDFLPFDTVVYKGSEFYLDNIPSSANNNKVDKYTYNLVFYGEEQRLSFVSFLDFVRGDNSDIDLITYSNGSAFSFIGTVHQLCSRILANINKYNSEVSVGVGDWQFLYDLTDENKVMERTISINEGMSCLDALKLVFAEYDLKYKFNGRMITITDKPTSVINHTFTKHDGLTDISAAVNSDDAVVTRLYPQGGTRNLPLKYKSTALPLSDMRYCHNLLLPNNSDGSIRFYIDAAADKIAKYGTRSKTLSEPFKNIYPSIRNITLKDIYGDTLPEVGNDGVVLTGLSANRRVDKIIGSDDIKADSGNVFNIYVTDLGFDLGKRKSGEIGGDAIYDVPNKVLSVGVIGEYLKENVSEIYAFTINSDYSYNLELPEITIGVKPRFEGAVPSPYPFFFKCRISIEKKYGDIWLDVSPKRIYTEEQIYTGIEHINFKIKPDNLNFKYQTSGEYRIVAYVNGRKNGTTPETQRLMTEVTSTAFTFKRLISDNTPNSGRYEYASASTGIVSVRSGVYGGFEFEMQYDGIGKLPTDSAWYKMGARYKIPVKRYEIDGELYPTVGSLAADTEIVLLNILMPPIYVTMAENRLQTYAVDWLDTYSKENFTVNVSLSTGFALENPTLFNDFVEWGRLRVKDDAIGLTQRELDIQSVTIEYKADSPFPKYQCTLAELPRLSWIEKLNKQLEKTVTNTATSSTTAGGGSVSGGTINTANLVTTDTVQTIKARKAFLDGLDGDIMGSAFDLMDNSPMYGKILRKDIADVASGFIAFLKGIGIGSNYGITEDGIATLAKAIVSEGIKSPTFSAGFDGNGMSIYKDENGNWHGDFDYVSVRKVFEVFALVVQKAYHVGGMQISSPAGGKITKVTAITGGDWECEHDSVDTFLVGDNVLCQTFTGTKIKRYWRRVVAVSGKTITLSSTICEAGSAAPEVDDGIAVYGGLNVDRQSIVVLASSGSGSPYFRMYKGVNSFSLDGKCKVDISPSNVYIEADVLKFTSGKSVEQSFNEINETLVKQQELIDGEISTWKLGKYDDNGNLSVFPPTLTSYPASMWDNATKKRQHELDSLICLDTENKTYYAKAWRFIKKDDGSYAWTELSDNDMAQLYSAIGNVETLANGKSTTYLTQPTSYKKGDTWQKNGKLYTAIQDSAVYVAAHWVEKLGYTDDTKANEVNAALSVERERINTQVTTTNELTGRVTTVEQNITPDSIWTGITNKVNGNRNLIFNSGEFLTTAGWAAIGFGDVDFSIQGNGMQFTIIGMGESVYIWGHLTQSFNKAIMIQGAEYTLTLKIYLPSSGTLRMGFRNASGDFYLDKEYQYTEGWNTFSHTLVYNRTDLTSIVIAPSYHAIAPIGYSGKIEYIKLEQGSESTAWTPAPEDIGTNVKTGILIKDGTVDIFGKTVVDGDLTAKQIEGTGLNIKSGDVVKAGICYDNGLLFYGNPKENDKHKSVYRQYDDGKYVVGDYNGARVEILPYEAGTLPRVCIYDTNGALVGQFDGTSVNSVEELFGSGIIAIKPTVSYSKTFNSSNGGDSFVTDTIFSFNTDKGGVLKFNDLIVSFSIQKNNWTPPSGIYGYIVLVRAELLIDDHPVSYGDLQGAAIDITSMQKNVNIKPSEMYLPKGTHTIKIKTTYMYPASGGSGNFILQSSANINGVTIANFNREQYISKIFANGLAFGTSATNHFQVLNTANGIISSGICGNFGTGYDKDGIKMTWDGGATWYKIIRQSDGTLKTL